jgi:chromosome segregation ATPase
MPDAETTQRLNNIDQRLDRLTGAVDSLVTEFLRPLAQQSVENQQSIGRLIERGEQFQEWLDDDRHDLEAIRADSDGRFQTLLGEAREDRKVANDKFESLQNEIRQNQRLLLSASDKFESLQSEIRQNQRLLLSANDKFESLQSEIQQHQRLLLSANDKFESLQSEIRQNQRLLLSGQERLDAVLGEVLSISRRVQTIEDVA